MVDNAKGSAQLEGVNHLAFSDFCHLDVNSLPFALKLRESPSDVIGGSVLPQDADAELRAEMERKRKQQMAELSERLTREKARELSLLPCHNKGCEIVRRRIEGLYKQREVLFNKIRESSEKKAEFEGKMVKIQMEGGKLHNIMKKLKNNINIANNELDNCRTRLDNIVQERRDLNKQVDVLMRQRTDLRRAVQAANNIGRAISYDHWGPKMDVAEVTLNRPGSGKKLYPILVHNGKLSYSSQLKGEVWSCCLKPKGTVGCVQRPSAPNPGRLPGEEILGPLMEVSRPFLHESVLTALPRTEQRRTLSGFIPRQSNAPLRGSRSRPHSSAGLENIDRLNNGRMDEHRPITAPPTLASPWVNSGKNRIGPKKSAFPAEESLDISKARSRPESPSPGTLKVFRENKPSQATRKSSRFLKSDPDKDRRKSYAPGVQRREKHNEMVFSRPPSSSKGNRKILSKSHSKPSKNSTSSQIDKSLLVTHSNSVL